MLSESSGMVLELKVHLSQEMIMTVSKQPIILAYIYSIDDNMTLIRICSWENAKNNFLTLAEKRCVRRKVVASPGERIFNSFDEGSLEILRREAGFVPEAPIEFGEEGFSYC